MKIEFSILNEQKAVGIEIEGPMTSADGYSCAMSSVVNR